MDNGEIQIKLKSIFEYNSKESTIQNIINRGYVCSTIESKDILFIGINPSYPKNSKPESYLYDVNEAVEKYPKHYKNFEQLVSKTKFNDKWTYIDLFYFRETNQKLLDLIITKDIEFVVNQLNLTNKIIKEIKPKIIVIANSKASNFFGVNKFIDNNENLTNIWYGLDFKLDKKTGLMKVIGINENSILENSDYGFYKDILFLFTSTFKYMNKFEKERLSWMIDKI